MIPSEPRSVGGAADPIRGITFDFWNTLIAEGGFSDHRVERWHEVMFDAGHDISEERLREVTGELWIWFTAEWEANRVVTPAQAAVETVGLLDLPADDALISRLVEVTEEGYDPSHMRVADGVGDALEGLKSAGLRVGIICDVGLTPSRRLRSYLDHHGLLRHFDHWSFSDEVGCYKPDARMFAHAAEGLGMTGSRLAHIGDLRRTDVAGARDAGWLAVRYTGFFDDTSEHHADGDVVIGHHAELLEALAW